MLNTMGISCNINVSRKAGTAFFTPNDAFYKVKKSERVLISSYNLYKLHQLGFNPKRLQINKNIPNRDASKFIKVKSVKHNYTKADTYCFKEQKKGMGIFNGYLTGQCAEVVLYTSKEQSAVCNLSSIALPKYVEYSKDTKKHYYNFEKLGDMTRILVRNLNNVIEYNYYPVSEAEYSNKLNRPIGIGTQGLADVFFKLKLPFESEAANQLNKKIFEGGYLFDYFILFFILFN